MYLTIKLDSPGDLELLLAILKRIGAEIIEKIKVQPQKTAMDCIEVL